MLSGLKTKPLKERQGPAVLKKKVRASNPHKSSVSGSIVRPVKKIPLTIHDEEDLLPVLLDEFPHLHLSLHTWHELWRKGLTQIEQITRAYQEVRRKKSLAQNQVCSSSKSLAQNQSLEEISRSKPGMQLKSLAQNQSLEEISRSKPGMQLKSLAQNQVCSSSKSLAQNQSLEEISRSKPGMQLKSLAQNQVCSSSKSLAQNQVCSSSKSLAQNQSLEEISRSKPGMQLKSLAQNQVCSSSKSLAQNQRQEIMVNIQRL
ncbi:hypothetical protein DPMN_017353 [Dreissena polymorpha]|uniref:Uncharacterized protein n=1 Tax=Dreissena polymorpha TaxID=45954 RepID=A0A9D4ND15_DREPO|nr:hypothetical protein DPMN_017353 [Dreissena polymorpha]